MRVREVELLAPAGKMEVLEEVIKAGADAVYVGGKRFNMRMFKPDYNFSDDELKRAVDMLHRENKKLYVTVNNLYTDSEVESLGEYLLFLEKIGVDALIVQDVGVVQLYKDLGLRLPLHGSVQMGLGNQESVQSLKENNVSRVILSKNLGIDEIRQIHENTNLGIEYFIHGDICISHTGQCYLSSFIFGDSGNRGMCHKPCRWQYGLQGARTDRFAEKQYYLAHHDLCLYPFMEELIDAGVCSFKIEGRMRSADFIANLVTIYRQGIDRLIDNPFDYSVDQQALAALEKGRIRNYTSGNLFRRTGNESIGYDGAREPHFATSDVPLTKLTVENYEALEMQHSVHRPELSVRVGDLAAMKRMLDAGVDNVIIGLENFRQSKKGWGKEQIEQAMCLAEGQTSKVFLETPHIVTQDDIGGIYELLENTRSKSLTGFIVNDLGSLRILRSSGREIWGGTGLNLLNQKALAFIRSLGVSRANLSQEFSLQYLRGVLETDTELELMIQGPLIGMISDYCIPKAVNMGADELCGFQCMQDDYALIDRYGQHYSIRSDEKCRNYVYYPYELCLFHHLPQLMSWPIKSFRIEGHFWDAERLDAVVTCYQDGMEQVMNGVWDQKRVFEKLLGLFPEGTTDRPLF